MDKLKVCVDLSNFFEEPLFGLYNAYKEREENILNENCKHIIGSDTLTEQLLLDSTKQSDFNKLLFAKSDSRKKLFEIALLKDKLWANGKKLKVKFLGGDDFLQQNVITYSKQWEKFANIGFDFISSGDAEIRIAFMTGKGSWSYIGIDALCITDQAEPTMNFGWFDNSTSSFEFSRTVIHEFGHCLGCVHEHQSPASNIKWNKPVVYDYYYRTQTPPWDKAKVDKNIFEKYSQSKISNSEFDPDSIMLYPIQKEFTTDGFSVKMNNLLSFHDTKFISKRYPKP